MKGSGSELKME
jgi:hypothetical protein